jgi:ADP-heptose:LPS heptosyltransferase
MCHFSFKKDTLIDILLPNNKLEIVPKNKNLVTIHIPDRWISRFYTEENFFDLISQLPQEQFKYVLTTDKSTKNKFKKIFRIFKIINNNNFEIIKNLKDNIIILEEPIYENWLAIIYSSTQVITPECGCTHISAACKIPVNVIYDPDNLPDAIYKEYHPWKSIHKKFVFGDLSLNKKIVDSLV